MPVFSLLSLIGLGLLGDSATARRLEPLDSESRRGRRKKKLEGV